VIKIELWYLIPMFIVAFVVVMLFSIPVPGTGNLVHKWQDWENNLTVNGTVHINNINPATNYMKLGINTNQPQFPVLGATDAYLYNVGQNLVIGTKTAGKYIKLFAGGNATSNEVARISDNRFNISGFATYWSYYGEMWFGDLEYEMTQPLLADRWECLYKPDWDKSDMSQFVAEGGNLILDHAQDGVYDIHWTITSRGEDIDTLFGVSINGVDPTRDCMQQEILTGHYYIQSGSCFLSLRDGDKLCLMARPVLYDESITLRFGNFNAHYLGDVV
jgi:hypothetical protein